MSIPSSLSEKLGPQALARGIGHAPSVSGVFELTMMPEGISQPVTLIQTILSLGPRLTVAHQLVNRLVNGGCVRVSLDASDSGAVIARMKDLGVKAVRL